MRKALTVSCSLLVLCCGLAAAVFTTSAHADGGHWTLNTLPQGYNFTETQDADTACYAVILIAGQVLRGDTCDPNFPAALDAFVNATVCTVNQQAGFAAGVCDAPAPPVTTPAPAPAPAPPVVTPPTQTVTETVTVIETDPTVDARLTALEQHDAVTDARLTELELKTGQILGEQKNETPFTDPA